MRVTAINETSDIGNYNFAYGLPLDLNPGETKVLSIVFRIPESASIGNHTIAFTTYWRYYDPNTFEWVDQDPLTVQGQLPVVQAPTPRPNDEPPPAGTTTNGPLGVMRNLAELVRNNSSLILSMVIAYAAIVLIASVFVIRHERSREHSPRL